LKHLATAVLSILNKQEKQKIGSLIILDLIIGILDIAFLGGMLLVINFYTNGGASTPQVITHYFSKDSLLLISEFFLLFGLKNWLGYRITRSQNFFFYRVASRLSDRNIRQYLKDSYIRFINVDSSVLVRKISQQPIEFSNYILTNVQQVVSQSVLIFFTIVAILFYHPLLFLLLFVLLLPPVVLLAWFIRKRLKNIRADNKITSEKTIQHLQETLAGYVESNVFGKDDFFVNRYYSYQNRLNENIATQQTLQGLPSRLIEVFAILGFFILVAINKWSANARSIDLLNIGVFMAASYKIIPGIVKILNSTGQIKAYEFTLKDLQPSAEITHENTSSLPSAITSLNFYKVAFGFKDRQVLNNCSFEIKAGDMAGISGHSGLGKTTIVNLLLGFLEQDAGVIMINDTITDRADRQNYWPCVSYVKQQGFFINDTILKNIILTDEAYDSDKLAEAISISGIDNMLIEYPEGINKLITENGKNISGGQRQRIMLARALYYDFDVLILDEPFNEMDAAAENIILSRLKQIIQQGKIIIFITHNQESLAFCNKIILPNGN
jgi:ABC-type bacteriocin/lantibiotic exporter with double-glycine peptidase domain